MAEHPKQTTIKQHTVPRCYLRGFADVNQNFYSFNKRYKKAKPASVRESRSPTISTTSILRRC